LLYLLTAIVYDQGDFGQTLVLKPFHGFIPFTVEGKKSTGSAGSDRIPENPVPWWAKKDYLALCYTNLENDPVIWEELYRFGYHLTIWGWCGWLVLLIGAAIQRVLAIRR
jgi:hypothetical protein